MKEGRASWTGVRNFQARNNLRAMKSSDLVFFYHSGEEKMVVGMAVVTREGYPDPTAKDGDWTAVDLVPLRALKRAVPLSEIKAEKALEGMLLVRHTRLSVMPLTPIQARRLLGMSGTKF